MAVTILRKITTACLLGTLFLLAACSEEDDNFDSWLGDYRYGETTTASIAGYSMIMSWKVSIAKTNDLYKALVDVNGQQTALAMTADIRGSDNTISFIYVSALDGFRPESISAGDTLFTFIKTAGGITTKWGKLEPRLSLTHPQECRCFEFTGTNKNNNTLRTQ